MHAEPKLLTRQELHQLVWAEPGTHLAARFGLSDTGLAKICRKLDVPRPPPGWWAKLTAGKSVRRASLPDPRPGTPTQITITPTPDSSDGLCHRVRIETARVQEIAVPDKLIRPHPLIAGWLADRRERQKQSRLETEPWRRGLYGLPALTATDRRRHQALHALFRALERVGASIGEDDFARLSATMDGEAIAFELREKLRQVVRPMTADEKRWETWNTTGVKRELEPTGFLQFTILAWTEQPVRKQWLESDRQSLDQMLPSIIATFVVLAPVLAEITRQREEVARRFAEAQRLAEEERQRRREDDNRWRRFLELAGDWQQAALAREFIATARAGDYGPNEMIGDRTLVDWIDWAERRAEAIDPMTEGSARVFSELVSIRSWTYRG